MRGPLDQLFLLLAYVIFGVAPCRSLSHPVAVADPDIGPARSLSLLVALWILADPVLLQDPPCDVLSLLVAPSRSLSRPVDAASL